MMFSDKKPLIDWLMELPEPYATKAVANMNAEIGSTMTRQAAHTFRMTPKSTAHEALVCAFMWGKTQEGFDYWADLSVRLQHKHNNA